MSYIVTNMTTGEEAAILGDLELAIALCDKLAAGAEDPYWTVIEHKMVYRPNETKPANKEGT